ncbi:MAG TPA: hypothetical protein PK323_08470 [Bacteroidia bacterium]|nr:hypothetical protein [Bacteroidia bacterium]
MKQITNLIIFLLCLCLVGFFASFAQNEYGIVMVTYAMIIIGILLLELIRINVAKYKKLGYFIHLMIIFPALSIFIWIYDKGDTLIIIFVLSMFIGFLYNILILPLILFYIQKKSKITVISFADYYELLFLSFLPISLYLRANHLIGAGILIGSSMFIAFPYLYQIFTRIKLVLIKTSVQTFFQISVYIYVGLSVIGTAFKIQHWPGTNLITNITLIFLFISITLILLQIIMKKEFNTLFNSMSSITKIVYFSYVVTGLWLSLKFIDLAPSVYSDEQPKAMQWLKANSNDVTEIGREFGKRFKVYEQNYERFIQEQKVTN